MHMLTVVLEHPEYCELSSIIFQKAFEKYQDAWVCYRDLCDVYTEGYYSVIYDTDKEFNLADHQAFIQEMRHNLGERFGV